MNGDSVSKIFGYVMGVILLFVLPLLVIMLNFDNELDRYANDAVVEFVDKSRSTGYISAENWETFVHKIVSTGKNYKIYVCHESVYMYPEAGGGYSTHYYSYFRDEIVSGIYQPSGTVKWNMKSGDYLRVSIEEENAGFGMKMFSSIFGTGEAKHLNTYGGYVGNNSN